MATKTRANGWRPRRRVEGDIQEEIEARLLDGWTPAQVYRWLQSESVKEGGTFVRRILPTLKTIQRMANDLTPRDSSGRWSLIDASSEDAAAVLPVLAAMVESSRGRITSFTKREASWIAKLRQALPDIPAWEAFRLARQYMVREDRTEPCHDLDLHLAFAPWRGSDARKAYGAAIHATGLSVRWASIGREPYGRGKQDSAKHEVLRYRDAFDALSALNEDGDGNGEARQ